MSGSKVKNLAKDMKANGFNQKKPIEVAHVQGKKIILDGHHRAAAAKRAGLKKVPIIEKKVSADKADQLMIEAAEASLYRK